jgi:hypothetical protein
MGSGSVPVSFSTTRFTGRALPIFTQSCKHDLSADFIDTDIYCVFHFANLIVSQ